ncbi:MAG TPA: PHP domain-containing protein [archaeon]|nr:PHP domain-containing protein [archaeon]
MRLRCDLHTHTNHSKDGSSSPEQLVRAAAAAGLAVLGVTDHDTLAGGLAAAAAAARLAKSPGGSSLLVIPGIELRTAEGDVLVYGVPHDLPPGRPLKQVIAAVRSHRGWLIAPHPFDSWRRGLGPALEGPGRRSAGLRQSFIAIEAFNARCYAGSSNQRALAFVAAHSMNPLAVSDSHHNRELGRCYTTLEATSRTPAAVFAAIADGKAQLTCASLPRLAHLRATLAKPFAGRNSI